MCLNISQLHTPDHITAHAEVLGGPVICLALLRLIMSHQGGVVWLHSLFVIIFREVEMMNFTQPPPSFFHYFRRLFMAFVP